MIVLIHNIAVFIIIKAKLQYVQHVDTFFDLLSVPLNEKVSEENEARDIAEEGLYVGRRPLVMAEERNKMENRLLQEPDRLVSCIASESNWLTIGY